MPHPRAVVAAVALGALTVAAPASAHQGNPNYRSIVRRVTPAAPGLKLQVLNFDDRLDLQNNSPWPVVIQGYNGEPYARVLPDGTVQVNRRSPAFYLNTDRTGTEKVPASANPKAPPQWQLVDRAGRFQWHDHRIHWMGAGLPPRIKDKSKPAKVFDWQVPVQIGHRKGAISGTLRWQPETSTAPVGAFAALGALALAALAAVALVRRRRRPAVGQEVEAW